MYVHKTLQGLVIYFTFSVVKHTYVKHIAPFVCSLLHVSVHVQVHGAEQAVKGQMKVTVGDPLLVMVVHCTPV